METTRYHLPCSSITISYFFVTMWTKRTFFYIFLRNLSNSFLTPSSVVLCSFKDICFHVKFSMYLYLIIRCIRGVALLIITCTSCLISSAFFFLTSRTAYSESLFFSIVVLSGVPEIEKLRSVYGNSFMLPFTLSHMDALFFVSNLLMSFSVSFISSQASEYSLSNCFAFISHRPFLS